MSERLAALVSSVMDLAYPQVCEACGGAGGTDAGSLCWDCRAALVPVTDPMCEVCGDPVDGCIEHAYRCSYCMRREPAFDRARSAVRYRGPAQPLVQALKYNGAVHVVRDWMPWLVACVRQHYARMHADAVTFVPLHPKKERERSYNQAHLLAGGLARELCVPLAGTLARLRYTETQTNLDMEKRRENITGAFAVVGREWVRGRRFLLVDDVMTTGATVNECARMLKGAGAAAVYVVTAARG
jgi:ComF family protein